MRKSREKERREKEKETEIEEKERREKSITHLNGLCTFCIERETTQIVGKGWNKA